jgi:MoaA/NifB/PqqE/SkfB family radical SAM enzyme
VASNVEKLIVSVDGLTEESYSAYRVGGSLQRVLDGIGFLRDARMRRPESRTEVVLQCLITKQSEQQIPDFKRLAERMHAAAALKTMQVYSMESAEKFLPVNEKYRRYNTGGGRLQVKSGQKNRCVELWERCIITWDGTIVPCCFDKDAGHPVGRFPDMSMKEAWVSPVFQAFRKRILDGRSNVGMCANCTEGLRIYR